MIHDVAVCVLYVLLWVSQICFVKLFVTNFGELDVWVWAIACAEAVKLFALFAHGATSNEHKLIEYETWRISFVEGRNLVTTALLYLFYNVASYQNLSWIPAATYKLVLSMRIIFAVAIEAALTKGQSISLSKATGCAMCFYSALCVSGRPTVENVAVFASVGAQALLSATAGAINERALKGGSFVTRNIYLYGLSLVFSMLFIAAKVQPFPGHVGSAFVGVVLLSAAAGIGTSFLLARMNNIVKTCLSAVEVFAVACVCHMLWGDELRPALWLGILLSLLGLSIYGDICPKPGLKAAVACHAVGLATLTICLNYM